MSAPTHDSIWNKNFVMALMANLFAQLGMNMSYGILSPYAEHLGGTPVEIGVVFSSFAISALLVKIVSGPATDSFDRKKILVAAVVTLAIAFTTYAFAQNTNMLVVGSLIRGLGGGVVSTALLAMAADTLPPEHIAQGIGFFSAVQAACSAFGPVIALNIALMAGYSTAYFINTAIVLVSIVWILRINTPPRENLPFKITFDRVFAKEAIVVAVLAMFLSFSYAASYGFVVVYGIAEGMPAEQVGLFFTAYAIVLLVSRPLLGKLADRVGYRKVLGPGIVAFAISFVILANAHTIPVLLLSAVVSSFGYGSASPLLQALAMKRTPRQKQGAASCTYYFGADIGFIIGPNVAGWIVAVWGYQVMWYTLIAPLAIALVFLFVLPVDEEQEEAAA